MYMVTEDSDEVTRPVRPRMVSEQGHLHTVIITIIKAMGQSTVSFTVYYCYSRNFGNSFRVKF